MSDERVIPTSRPADLPTFKILVDGTQIDTRYKVTAILVSKSVNRISSAQIILLDGDTATETFQISNTDNFIPGKEIEIHAGYHTDETVIFKGIIIKHGIKTGKKKSSVLKIECKDKAVKMAAGRKNNYYHDSKDSDIIEEIVNNFSLDNDIEATTLQHKEMIQYYSSDWDFIVSRADVNGKLVINDDGKITVKKPDSSPEPVLSLIYGSTMLEFEAAMDARDQFSSVKSVSWDYSSQELTESEAEEPALADLGNITSSDLSGVIGLDSFTMKHTGAVISDELQQWADAKMLKSRYAKIRGRVKCQGFADVKPGTVIELNGVGDRFNGKAYVSAIRHQINKDNWDTDIQFGLNPEWYSKNPDITDTRACGLVPAISGLQIGVVTQLENDPDGEDRVLVKVPVISTEDDGVWARVATLDAGENRGSFFRPEIGDEVILGFLNDDPRDPVIMGMLNSSAKPAPLKGSDDNHEKGFVTRSSMKLIFNDDKKSITVETPAGNKLVLDEDDSSILIQDQNSNKIKLSSDGISVESPGSINLKATGDVKIEGANVQLKANAEFKAEGSAGAKVESSAIAELKGSLVKIN